MKNRVHLIENNWESFKAYVLWLKDQPFNYHLDDDPSVIIWAEAMQSEEIENLCINSRMLKDNCDAKQWWVLWNLYGDGEPLVYDGTYSGHLHDGIMEWECPITNEPRQSQGEFDCDGEYYYHRECTESGDLIYIVRAK